jgi:hypothetical protein
MREIAYPSSMIRTKPPMRAAPETATPARQVRADFDEDTIVVYQAYAAPIADAALAAGTFVAPFKLERMQSTSVRVQWDPERSLRLERLEHRAIQIGLTGPAVRRYVGEWIVAIDDVTPLAREIHALVTAGDLGAARALLPAERPYPLPAEVAQIVGAG